MQKYLDQLSEDIDKLLKAEAPYSMDDDLEINDENLFKMEESFLLDDGYSVAEYTNISMEQLPAPGLLSDSQTSFLSDRLITLLEYYNFHPEFPEGVPGSLKYTILRSHWNKFKAPKFDFHIHYEFCEYDEKKCPFPGYCSSCEEVWGDNEISEELDVFDEVVNNASPNKEMLSEDYVLSKKDDIKMLVKNLASDNYVPGIYNFCDRWCERCSMTEKCAQFALERKEFRHSYSGLSEETFHEDMKASFIATYELLEELMEKQACKIEDIHEDNPNESVGMPDEDNKLFALALEYSGRASKWLNEINITQTIENAEMTEIINQISYYHIFLTAKIGRAISFDTDDKDADSIQSDKNGSAKVALIAIEKSLDAWSYLIKNISKYEDESIKNSVLLCQIRKAVNLEFPDAEKFVRPGFD